MTDTSATTPFDAYYFAHACGRPYQRDDDWLEFFGTIADRIVENIRPTTVLDAGCAMGFLVEALRARDVAAWGVDISEYAIDNVHADVAEYCWCGSVTDPFPQEYDLIVCIEVLEHMPADEAEAAVANLCAHSDDVLFSSSPFDYKEPTHFNVRPPEYWAELFARHGFYRDVDFDASFVTSWAVRFQHKQQPAHRLVRDYERKFWPLWQENVELRALAQELRDRIAASEDRTRTLERRIAERDRVIDEITSSPAWALIERLHPLRRRVAPPGSRREEILLRVVETFTT